MPRLVPGIHVLKMRVDPKTWMAGTTLAAYGRSPGHDDADRSRSKTADMRRRTPSRVRAFNRIVIDENGKDF
jgi:hypothetical protein